MVVSIVIQDSSSRPPPKTRKTAQLGRLHWNDGREPSCASGLEERYGRKQGKSPNRWIPCISLSSHHSRMIQLGRIYLYVLSIRGPARKTRHEGAMGLR